MLGKLCVIAGVALLGLSVLGPSVTAANNALSGWTVQGSPTGANWQVQPSGNSVYVVPPNPDAPQSNGSPSFFVSPFTLTDATFKINITANTEGDDDYVGLVLGYQKPLNDAACGTANCDTDFYLFDWKRAQEQEGGSATVDGHEGFSLMHVRGVRDVRSNNTTDHIVCFWTHANAANTCDVLGTKFGFGTGYVFGVTNTLQVTYKPTQIKIVLLGSGGAADQTLFDVAPGSGTFAAGRVGFYNYSQPNVEYGYDDGTVPTATTTTTSTSVVTSTTAKTNVTVGPATKTTLVRTGQNGTTAMVELVGGLALLVLGALMSASRGRRPVGKYFSG